MMRRNFVNEYKFMKHALTITEQKTRHCSTIHALTITMMKTIKNGMHSATEERNAFHCFSEQRERTKLRERRGDYRNNFCCSTAKITGIIQRVRDYVYNTCSDWFSFPRLLFSNAAYNDEFG